MRFRKSVSLVLVGSLFAQSLAPLAYAQQGGGGGMQQQVDPIVSEPTDPGDVIVPDNYADLPVPHPAENATNYDGEMSGMWTVPTRDLVKSIDYGSDPKDPDLWYPAVQPPTDPWGNLILGRPIWPWESGKGGSIIGGETLINPPITSGGGKGGGVIQPPPSNGGGGSSSGAGEIYGRTNTQTGYMDFDVPVVNFSGKGSANVDLKLHIPAYWTMNSGLPTPWLWADSYAIRLDASTQAGTALITFPTGLKVPFTKSSSSTSTTELWVSPNGFAQR
jgi:hypothetical protein